MKKFLLFLFLITTANFAEGQVAQKSHLLVGTYTEGRSKGIYVFEFDSRDGSSRIVDSVITSNPSFLSVSPDGQFVYAVNEESDGKISAFRFDKERGKLHFLNQVSSLGAHPCYITVDKKGKWVIAGNYSSGDIVVYAINKDGSLGALTAEVQHTGKSITPRQTSPHVHATVLSPDNKFLLATDLGIDKVMVYKFNDETGTLSISDSTARIQKGAGPRHLDFHPSGRWVYLLEELSGTVTFFNYKKGKLDMKQTLSTLPPGYTGRFTSADIHVSSNGKYLYTSNRDSLNTISVFAIQPNEGYLRPIQSQSTLGKTPRNFNIDPSGNFLLVANQNSNEIVVLNVNKETGLLTDALKRISVGSPVCLKWIY